MQKLVLLLTPILSSLLFLFYGLPDERILKFIRIPELLLTFGLGGTLAYAGAVFQGTLKNPLAEPYTLGIASGAGFGATLFSFLKLPIEAGALTGGLTSVFLLLFAYTLFKDTLSILLFGVGISSLLSALILLLYAILPVYSLQDALFFTLGYITPVSIKVSLVLFLISLLFLFVFSLKSRSLDLLSLGDETAFFSGIEPERERVKLLVLSSIPISLFVSECGIIGFVGIVVPHISRFLGFRVGGELLFSSYLIGASFLTLSQLIAKNLVLPTVLPSGAVTAVLGVPFFLYVLWRYSGGRG